MSSTTVLDAVEIMKIIPHRYPFLLVDRIEELEPGSGMDTGIRQGWPIVLSSLKSLLETGKGLDVFAKPS